MVGLRLVRPAFWEREKRIFQRKKYPWLKSKEWRPLILLGLFNTTIYLGATFWALHDVSAGLFYLFVTANPFVVAFLSYIWLKRR
ncbi:EamA family transporter [Brevibacillus sp. B_LB10_24]|uniref:EamA family transporter n=1 Tax=Brevibacillus sp. B_LB10_24 TaxID=3380645 RepID=UPI0038BCA1EE